ncbi:MAG: hypothetical protein BWY66_01399 [bacterium ADurb.Bin374]|nr:MAG: hypothetical protein BWY66_01399 [bacterium ADurb.Bin374]
MHENDERAGMVTLVFLCPAGKQGRCPGTGLVQEQQQRLFTIGMRREPVHSLSARHENALPRPRPGEIVHRVSSSEIECFGQQSGERVLEIEIYFFSYCFRLALARFDQDTHVAGDSRKVFSALRRSAAGIARSVDEE